MQKNLNNYATFVKQKNDYIRKLENQVTVLKTVCVVLIVIAVLVSASRAYATEPQVIRCTDGTQYIYIRYPGMCPVEFWEE